MLLRKLMNRFSPISPTVNSQLSSALSNRCYSGPISIPQSKTFESALTALQPISNDSKSLLVVLDLDEMLISASFREKKGEAAVDVTLPDGDNVHITLRPKIEPFLQWMSQHFTLGLYTAGVDYYAKAVMNLLDPKCELVPKENRRFRQHCIKVDEYTYLKDLSIFKHDMKRTVLIDNNILSFISNPSNGILVESFEGQEMDDTRWENELFRVANLLQHLSSTDIDVQKELPQFRDSALNEKLQQLHKRFYGAKL